MQIAQVYCFYNGLLPIIYWNKFNDVERLIMITL
ncbi:hypothetical protein C804_05490 [Lachnospiraceae bacterium A4]|nr:hypothetical protein C804_05490 [Lachnospiraceae bacterium A4]